MKPFGESRNLARHDDFLNLDDLFGLSKDLLLRNGTLNIIYPYVQKDRLFLTAKKYGLHPVRMMSLQANENKAPNRLVVAFALKKNQILTESLCVKNVSTNEYSEEFIKLTESYYLKPT